MSDILIVGAGAVGQVFGYYLSKGGQNVTYFVKEKYLSTVRERFLLHRVFSRKKIETYEWSSFEVLSALSELSNRSWKQIWVCISSDALSSEFTREVLSALPPRSSVFGFQPGPFDRERLTELCPQCTVSMGTINFSSTASPIVEIQKRRGGLVFFIPSYIPILFEGERSVTDTAVHFLSAGGMKAKSKPGAWEEMVSFGPLLISFVAGLELAGWKFQSFLKDSELAKLTARAAEQGSIAVKDYFNPSSSTLSIKFLTTSFVYNLIWKFFRKMMPFDFEEFFRVHFSKLYNQTDVLLETYSRIAAEANLKVDAIDELRERLSHNRKR